MKGAHRCVLTVLDSAAVHGDGGDIFDLCTQTAVDSDADRVDCGQSRGFG